jgi:nucleoside-diphosphate-sugar epimerase
MKLLVTGAGGFLGRFIVAEAIQAGHEVCALLRPMGEMPDQSWLAHPRLRIARADLRRRNGLAAIVAGADAVLHVAAAKTGDLYAQFAGTVVATENLLAAMDQSGVDKIIAVSSLSVYDYRASRLFSTIDECSPLERRPFERDGYTQAKLAQEKLIRAHASARGWDFAILRPGAIFGAGNLMPARAGMQIGDRTIVRLGGFAPLPLVYVENCAAAVVLAAEITDPTGPVFNLIDDGCPTQRQYVRMLQRRLSPRPRIVPMPWAMLQSAAIGAEVCNKLFFSGRAKIPGLLLPARLAARINPFRYDNRKSKEVLGWSPRYTLAEALDRSVAGVAVSIRKESAAVPLAPARKVAA